MASGWMEYNALVSAVRNRELVVNGRVIIRNITGIIGSEARYNALGCDASCLSGDVSINAVCGDNASRGLWPFNARPLGKKIAEVGYKDNFPITVTFGCGVRFAEIINPY